MPQIRNGRIAYRAGEVMETTYGNFCCVSDHREDRCRWCYITSGMGICTSIDCVDIRFVPEKEVV
jgi:hypothetical protein